MTARCRATTRSSTTTPTVPRSIRSAIAIRRASRCIPTTGELWSTEFGPRGGDELNRIEAGKNYGWILVTHGAHYNGDPVVRGAENVPGMVDPALFWVPSINPGNISFYTGDKLAGLARRPVARDDVAVARAHQLRRRRQARRARSACSPISANGFATCGKAPTASSTC